MTDARFSEVFIHHHKSINSYHHKPICYIVNKKQRTNTSLISVWKIGLLPIFT